MALELNREKESMAHGHTGYLLPGEKARWRFEETVPARNNSSAGSSCILYYVFSEILNDRVRKQDKNMV